MVRPLRTCIGSGLFRGFVRRWKDEISYSKSKNTAHYRKEHCTYANFEAMYDTVYSLLEQGGYAVKLDTPVFTDEAGNRCEEDKCFGKSIEHAFTKPNLVFCADE